MKTLPHVDVIYTHTEGEPTCIVHSGVRYPHGLDILGKRRHLEQHYDWLRKALMQEPRGHRDMYGVFLTPPTYFISPEELSEYQNRLIEAFGPSS